MATPIVAIIGAGLTGLTAARELHSAGIPSVIFDKSHGVSGRMATRRVEYQGATLRFDHGTAYLTQTQAKDIAQVLAPNDPVNGDTAWQHFRDAANLVPWHTQRNSGPTKFVSPTGINNVGKALAADLNVHLNTAVTQAHWHAENSKWQLVVQDSPLPTAFDLIITTTPPVQAANILAKHQGNVLSALLDRQPMACWTLMLATQEPLAETNQPEPGDIISRVVGETSKNRPFPENWHGYTVQADRNWSQRNVDLDADQVAATLLQKLKEQGWRGMAIGHQRIHRWLYAGVANPVSQPCLTDPQRRLICAGDWCVGNDLDSALLSGRAAGRQALEFLD